MGKNLPVQDTVAANSLHACYCVHCCTLTFEPSLLDLTWFGPAPLFPVQVIVGNAPMRLGPYLQYADNNQDEMPLYMFDKV